MESSTLKEDFETEVQSGENELKGEPGLAALELTTIDHIMDQIHREVAELKQVPRTRQSERKAVQCRKWSQTETQDFLRVLSQIGPDFTCMELHQCFWGRRCRRELRNKFRKQQRTNGVKVEGSLDLYYDGRGVENCN